MKRHKSLFDEIASFENLLAAANKARRGKRYDPQVLAFHHRLESELLSIRSELHDGAYRPAGYRVFTVCDPKQRRICAAPYRDRVVHHALCNVVEPIYERAFIFDSYACRPGKGTHAAADRLTRFMQSATYVLKCDIRRYFASVDHGILKSTLRRKIGCDRTLELVDRIIDSAEPETDGPEYFAGDDLLTPLSHRCGLPIGNQTSQFFANVYLDPLDHFIKESLGCRRYIRYVDDFVILDCDRRRLWRIRAAVEEFLNERARLRLHPKKQYVSTVAAGIDFVGYRVYPDHRRLRRSSGVRFARRLRTMQKQYVRGDIDGPQVALRIVSWIGHAAHADTYGLRASLLGGAVFRRADARDAASCAVAAGTTRNLRTSGPPTETGTNPTTGTTTTGFGVRLARIPHSIELPEPGSSG